MQAFLETTFGPNELSIVDQAFRDWLAAHHLTKDSPEAELGTAIIITLYREGHVTRKALDAAMSQHRGLADLTLWHQAVDG